MIAAPQPILRNTAALATLERAELVVDQLSLIAATDPSPENTTQLNRARRRVSAAQRLLARAGGAA